MLSCRLTLKHDKAMAKIYVASSWRNSNQQQIVNLIRRNGHQVYDFRHPNDTPNNYRWDEIDPEWKKWDITQYMSALSHPIAEVGFNNGLRAMMDADVCVLLLPCGKSAHAQAGFMAGQGKKVVAVMMQQQEAELMYKLFDKVVTTPRELIAYLDSLDHKPKEFQVLNLVLENTYYDMILHKTKREEYREIKPYWTKRLFFLSPGMNGSRTGNVNGNRSGKENGDDKEKGNGRRKDKEKETYPNIPDSILKEWEEKEIQINTLITNGTIIPKHYTHICFRRGYTNTPLFVEMMGIQVGYGKPKWGAPKQKEVFILQLGNIINT